MYWHHSWLLIHRWLMHPNQSNGLTSFVDYGLVRADGGFGPYFDKPPSAPGDFSTALGHLTLPTLINNMTSLSNKIDELSTMMTAGRLSAENKQVIQVSIPRKDHFHWPLHNSISTNHSLFYRIRMPTHTSSDIMASNTPIGFSWNSWQQHRSFTLRIHVRLFGWCIWTS